MLLLHNEAIANTLFAYLESFIEFLPLNLHQKYEQFITKLVRDYYLHPIYGFTKGTHYNHYRDQDSDITSNSSEVQNRLGNDDAKNCTIVDYCHHQRSFKAKAHSEKLDAFKDEIGFNLRRKGLRERWTQKWQIFVDFDQLPEYLQTEQLITYLLDISETLV